MLASVTSATLLGVDGRAVTVEIHVARGLPAYHVVGLPDTAVRESRERVRAALVSSELAWPTGRITVNLAPGGIPKTGSGLELAVALGILVATSELAADSIDGVGVIGELGLDGRVRSVPGVLALVDALTRRGVREVIVPADDVLEAGLVPGVTARGARSLAELRACLKDERPWPDAPPVSPRGLTGDNDERAGDDDVVLDLADVRGLPWARQAAEVAAAGRHHLLLAGPPGAGKTMLARRLVTILPALPHDQALEVARIHSATGHALRHGLPRRPPFRAPHHTATVAALIGGGSPRPRAGEITKAHHGVLFLDELGEFGPQVLDALRQPLEEQVVRIARQALTLAFPADFLLVACTNPCPCGLGPPRCTCQPAQLARYRRRLCAPVLDRFDLRLAVRPPLPRDAPGEDSRTVAARVHGAAERQRRRFTGCGWSANGRIPGSLLERFVPLGGDAAVMWRSQIEEAGLTGRGAAAIRRVARTLADLADEPDVRDEHVACAALLRSDVP